MKKYLLISPLIILGILVLVPSPVSATSGACSYHNGVNCSAGPSSTGDVTCNDGWVNSSVAYYDADECKVKTTQCTYPVQPSCNLSAIEQQKQNSIGSQTAINARSGLLGSDFGNASVSNAGSQYDTEYYDCQNQQIMYQVGVTAYNNCTKANDDLLAQQRQSVYTALQSKYNAICVSIHGQGSIWDESLQADSIGAKCTESQSEKKDAIFEKYFKLAMDGLPEYKNIVDKAVIKTLAFDPANANTTFTDIIINRYHDVLFPKATTTPASTPQGLSFESKITPVVAPIVVPKPIAPPVHTIRVASTTVGGAIPFVYKPGVTIPAPHTQSEPLVSSTTTPTTPHDSFISKVFKSIGAWFGRFL